MVDGAESSSAPEVLGALQSLWGLGPMTKAFMMSLVFIGVFIGNLIGGTMADSHGRRPVVLGCYLGMIILGIMTAMVSGPASMLVVRFLFGIAYGMGTSPGIALQVESAPAAWRGHLLNFGSIFFSLGELYTALLLLVFMPTLQDPEGKSWRHVTLLDVIPGLVVMPFAFLLLQESPHYLLTKGKFEEALGVVKHIAFVNGKEEDSIFPEIEGQAPELASPSSVPSSESTSLLQDGSLESRRQQWGVLFGKEYRLIVLGGSYLCFVANFLFYGLSYGLPQTFSSMGSAVQPGMQVVIVALWGVPGVLLSLLLLESKTMGHRDGLALLASASTLLQLSLMTVDLGSEWHWLGLPSAYLSKYITSAFFTITYVYLGEVFPSVIRCTGLSICIAFGRFGSMTAPMLFELLAMLNNPVGPHAAFLMLNSVLSVVAVLAIKVCFSYELKNAPLEDLMAVSAGRDADPRRASRAPRPRRLSLDGSSKRRSE
eukprot:CAMPEP_0171156148 /NCGR_PEP_ID=MMETSP0790-20130122/1283_1 /TAXON_ID=2925 /ORGANISM="Alexandrium catenella, Strain OF101" /LENGTH=484 /DNA_ID=CAMNT_0011620423 /DNA_START=96 /DNA_END=1548 /DNA_ORIENTATION=-